MVGARTNESLRIGVVVAVAALGSALAGPALAAGSLADAAAQKAAVKCQALVAKTTAKALATKIKAFEACSAAALACVQSKYEKADCPTKAAGTCTKKLASATAAATKARAKITSNKSCLALSTADLLAADGLGFGAIAAECASDPGVDVCDGLEPIAACLLGDHDLAAGDIAGRSVPRLAELLGLLGPPIPGATGLPPYTGCGDCGALPPELKKGVEKCGKALTGGARAVATTFENAFGACTLAHYECLQAQAGDAACTTAATAACTKAAAKITKAIAKLGTAATKACGTDYATASPDSGLGLTSLAGRCTDLGVADITAPSGIAACLAAEARCTVAELARTAVPRTTEIAPSALGTLASDLGATCPLPPGLTKSRTLARGATQPRVVFGSILKIMKSVKRTVPSALSGVRASGGKPTSTGGGSGGISGVTGPGRVKFGAINKYKVTYHGARSRVGGGLANGVAPELIVTVTQPGIQLDDHFELQLLDLPMNGDDVEDEIEVEFADALPACAFELSFATKIAGDVSDYASIPQVLDEKQGPTAPSVELVSRGPNGVQQNAAFAAPAVAISAGGRYVAFTSTATNLVATPDTGGEAEVFLRDRCVAFGAPVANCTPATTLESRGFDGLQDFHTGALGHVGVSDDARYVAFDANATGDPMGPTLFVRDRCLSNGTSVGSCSDFTDYVPDYGTSSAATGFSMASDGRYFAYTSDTAYPQPGATPVPVDQAVVWDRCVSTAYIVGGCTEGPTLVSEQQGLPGIPGTFASMWAAIARGGRWVAFRSDDSNLIFDEDTNEANDVFIRDLCVLDGVPVVPCTPTTERVNLTQTFGQSTGDDPFTPALTNVAVSQNGRYVAFTSTAIDLLGANGDTNGKRDVFVRDLCRADGNPVPECVQSTVRVNVGPNGSESNGDIPGGQSIGMSADGRFVVFASDATNLLGNAVGSPNGTFQIFLRDRCVGADGIAIPGCTAQTTLVSAAPDKGLGTASSSHPTIDENGSTTAFLSAAGNLLGPAVDANGVADVFARDR